MKRKRVLAIVAVILILLLYGSTLVFAFLDHPQAPALLTASLFCTIVGPGILYGYRMILNFFRKR